MKFRSVVYIRRGGHVGFGKGSYRYVRAMYIERLSQHDVVCELLEDDPLAIMGPFLVGGASWWSASVICKSTELLHCGGVRKPKVFSLKEVQYER